MERTEYSDEAENFDSLTSLEPQVGAKKKKNKAKNKRRFTDEQISLLESIFEADSKLEPKRKVQIARELGLQPRQVAIWFQNRRARWKSKQIEHDFRTLRADYDSLATRFESLKEEKQSLIMQLQKLNDLMGKQDDVNKEGNPENTDGNEVRPSYLQEELEQRAVTELHKTSTISYDVGEYEDEGHELLKIGHIDTSVSPHHLLHRLDSGILLDPSRCSSHWLNFWP